MKSFSWTLALRYLNPLRTFVSVITLISLLGVAFGVMVLIVVLSVHNGFERNLKDTLLGQSPHLSAYPLEDQMKDWEAEEVRLGEIPGIESAYALVEGYALIDTRRWQRPVYFRAFNTENEGQIEALEGLLDPDYPDSSADFNPVIEDVMAPPSLDLLDDSNNGEMELPSLETEEIYGNRYAVISSRLAEGIGVGPGDTIRLVAAKNLDEVMRVYSLPAERAWDLYPEYFDPFVEFLESGFKATEGEEVVASEEDVRTVLIGLAELVDGSGRDGIMEVEPKAMRSGEEELIRELMNPLSLDGRLVEGNLFYPKSTLDTLNEIVKQLQEFDLEEGDNQEFRQMKEIVLPKTLKIQGVYKVSERTQGPDLFIPVEIGMELKGIESAETIGLRIGEPYEAEEFVGPIQSELGPGWQVESWMTMHADRFQLVKTEKLMMTFALSFLTLLSAFSITAVMYTVTLQKRQEIGVMKALGATPSQIVRVFVYQGLVVGVVGALAGLGLGLLAIRYREGVMALIRNVFGVDPFPAEFHGMSELPAYIDWNQITLITIVAVILCLIAALIPALIAAFRDPAKSLRNL